MYVCIYVCMYVQTDYGDRQTGIAADGIVCSKYQWTLTITEFHDAVTALLTACLPNYVLLNGICSSGTDDKRIYRVLLHVTMCQLRYAGIDVRPILDVSTASL